MDAGNNGNFGKGKLIGFIVGSLVFVALLGSFIWKPKKSGSNNPNAARDLEKARRAKEFKNQADFSEEEKFIEKITENEKASIN